MIRAIFEEKVSRYEDLPAVICDGNALTYGMLRERVARQAAVLPEKTSVPTRVLIRKQQPLEILIQVLACWYGGLVPVVLRSGMPANQIEEIERLLSTAGAVSEFPDVSMDVAPSVYSNPERDFLPRDEALVICTSGTTGVAKLVALPAESVMINASHIGKRLNLQPGDVVGVLTPLGFMYGLMGGCMASLFAGAACHLHPPGNPLPQVQQQLIEDGVSVIQGPPSFLRVFLAYWNGVPFSGVRLVTTGGEPMDDGLRQQLGHAFPHARHLFLYGMTEAGPRLSDLSFEEGGGEDGRIGLPYPHVEWFVESVPGFSENERKGRLVLRGPGLFLGYIQSDGTYAGLEPDGFFKTNDLVSREEDGRLYFRGRLDRVFRSGGRLVNPSAAEAILRSHPCVEAAVCRQVAHPLLGLAPEADLSIRSGAMVSDGELKEFCAQHMEPHVIPRKFHRGLVIKPGESGKASLRSTL